MPANYLHGVETVEVERGPRPVRVVKSAVIALVGTAPVGPVNANTLCLTEKDGAQFGPALPGFTIPQAMDAIYDHGAGTVIAINVLDPAVHKTTVTDEAAVLDANTGKVKTSKPALLSLIVKDGAAATTYVQGTDYTVDLLTGELARKPGGGIANGAALKLTFEYADPTKVTAADIIGSVLVSGQRTGLKLLHDSYNLFGFFAKLIIAPVYCTQTAVAVELIALADAIDAQALIDAPIGTTFTQAITGRGPAGSINFNTSSDRAILCYPHLKVLDVATNTERLEPHSQRLAGLMAAKDLDKGYWWSPSNTEYKGVIGTERPLTARIDDPQSEVNLLNEVGICTVFNSFGTGLKSFGNRTAAWPTVSHPRNFINVRRTADIINESIRYFSAQFIDAPITQALIDSIVESANAFGRKLVGDGALIGFKAWYDPARNPKTELNAGHLLISYKFTVALPLERLTYETEITDEYLVFLKKAA